MAATKIADIIEPDVFNPYIIERTAELTELYLGGIISTDETLSRNAQAGGRILNVPFWKDLTGADEVLSDAAALTPGNITTDKDVTHMDGRGRAWGANDLAESVSGDDPLRAVADLVAQYWNRQSQTLLLQKLAGVFADNEANDAGDMVHDVAVESIASQTAATQMGADAVIDAMQTMGDNASKLTAIAMHSAMFARLQKQEVIVYLRPSGTDIQFPTYLGKRLIVDDNLPVVAGATDGFKYTSYLFGEGAIAFAEGNPPVRTETDRDSLAGEDYLINRRHFVLHPRGVKYTGTPAGDFPSNAEVALAASWDRVYERKNVRLAKLVTN